MHEVLRLGRRFILSLGGEGTQSAFHFLLNLFLIRLLNAHDYGVFAIVFVLGGVALTYCNALVSVPTAVHLPRLRSPGAGRYQEVMLGSIALLFALAVGIAVATGLFLTLRDLEQSLAGGTFVGLWMLRNHVRTVLFAYKKNAIATLADVSYTIGGVAFVALMLRLHSVGAGATSAIWGLALANLLGIAVALFVRRSPLRVSYGSSVWRRYRKIWRDVGWSLVGTTTWTIQGQALAFLVAAFAGPSAYAPVAAGALLFSPLRPAVSAFINVFRTEFVVAVAEHRYRRLSAIVHAVAGAVALACMGVGVGFWLGWPLLEKYVFAGKFADASMPLVVTLSGVAATLFLTYAVPLTLIQAAGNFRAVAIATSLGAVTGLAVTSILLSVTSVAWSILGLVAGEAVCGVYLWLAARDVLRAAAAASAWQSANAVPART